MNNPEMNTDLPSKDNQSDDNSPVCYTQGVKFDVIFEKEKESLDVTAIVYHIFQTLKNSKKDNEAISFLDTQSESLDDNLENVQHSDLPAKLCMERTKTRNSKILSFGCYIRTNISITTLKERCFTYFDKHRIYMKTHKPGFFLGINWIPIGFFLKIHPVYGDHQTPLDKIIDAFDKGRHLDIDYWTTEKQEQLQKDWNEHYPKTPFPNGNDLPLSVQANTITAYDSKGNSARILATTVVVPQKLATIGEAIMSYLTLQEKEIPPYIPQALQKTDPDEYFYFANQHIDWMDDHRNIQIGPVNDIMEYDHESDTTSNKFTLKEMIIPHPAVHGISYDATNKKVNVSVAVDRYAEMKQHLAEQLAWYKFKFNPKVIQRTRSAPVRPSPPSSNVALIQALAKHRKTPRDQEDQNTEVTNSSTHDNETATKPSYASVTKRRAKRTSRFDRLKQQQQHDKIPKYVYSDGKQCPFSSKSPKQAKGTQAKVDQEHTNTTTQHTSTDNGQEEEGTDSQVSPNVATTGGGASIKSRTKSTRSIRSHDSGLTASSNDKSTITEIKSTISTLTKTYHQDMASLRAEFKEYATKAQETHIEKMNETMAALQKQQIEMQNCINMLLGLFGAQQQLVNANTTTPPPEVAESIEVVAAEEEQPFIHVHKKHNRNRTPIKNNSPETEDIEFSDANQHTPPRQGNSARQSSRRTSSSLSPIRTNIFEVLMETDDTENPSAETPMEIEQFPEMDNRNSQPPAQDISGNMNESLTMEEADMIDVEDTTVQQLSQPPAVAKSKQTTKPKTHQQSSLVKYLNKPSPPQPPVLEPLNKKSTASQGSQNTASTGTTTRTSIQGSQIEEIGREN